VTYFTNENQLNPLVSIIIPTYNRASLLQETLRSVYNQTYQNWECIIVDDGSTDNTCDIIAPFISKSRRFKFFLRGEKLKGGNTCRNIGISKSSGEFLYFFDSDDVMYPNLLEIFLLEFNKNKKLDFCCCECDYFENDKIIRSTNHFVLPHTIEGHLKNYGFMAPSFFISRKVIFDIGEWDEKILRLQDVDYFNKLFFLNKKGIWINKCLFKKRIHSKNISSAWNRQISLSLLTVHEKIDLLYKDRKSRDLEEILGRRITALSISALASGYWIIAWRHFWRGLKLLPRAQRLKRVSFFLSLSIKKPFIKNSKDILMHY
jgi:glycosyltransferase involved in cell wall biosynthesis